MKKMGVGILGCGVVGSALVRTLLKSSGDIFSRCGAEFEIKKIADLIPDKAKEFPDLPSGTFTTNLQDVIQSDDIQIVVELMGGEEPAFGAIQKAMESGKHVVTANKLLLAKRGEAIFQTAEKSGVEIGIEASVAGAVPVIRTLKEAIAGGQVESVFGIINGTANYILTSMTESNAVFSDVLAEAQRLGYAEADPAFDIEGIDAAHKITIMASLAFGTPVDFDSVYIEGITSLTPEDFDFAKQFGKVIKLLAIARLDDGQVDVRVHPAMLPCHEPLARIDGVTNAVKLEVSHAGDLMLVGPGAGGAPTSSALIANMVEIARNVMTGSVGRVSPFGFKAGSRKPLPMKPMEDIETRYYLRFHVEDKPGVLAIMAGIIGDNRISIESAIQRSVGESVVPLVIITHTTREKNIRSAVETIDKLETTRDKTMIIRLEDGK